MNYNYLMKKNGFCHPKKIEKQKCFHIFLDDDVSTTYISVKEDSSSSGWIKYFKRVFFLSQQKNLKSQNIIL